MEDLLSARRNPAIVKRGIVGRVGETTIRQVSADIADKGVQSNQNSKAAIPPRPKKIGRPQNNEKMIEKKLNHKVTDDSRTCGIETIERNNKIEIKRVNLFFNELQLLKNKMTDMSISDIGMID